MMTKNDALRSPMSHRTSPSPNRHSFANPPIRSICDGFSFGNATPRLGPQRLGVERRIDHRARTVRLILDHAALLHGVSVDAVEPASVLYSAPYAH